MLKHTLKCLFIQNGNAKAGCFVEFASGRLASQYKIGFLGH